MEATAKPGIGGSLGSMQTSADWLRKLNKTLRTLWVAVLESAAALPASVRRAERDRLAERLMDDYGNSILRLAYSYLHNEADAKDILQDTLIQYFKTLPTLETPAHEKAWLLRVAANLSKNRIDYNRVRAADELSEELVAEQREDLAFVWEAVKALPVIYREVIHLFYQEGYSTAQIASLLGENEVTVRSRLSRGRAKLKTVLKEAYDFAE